MRNSTLPRLTERQSALRDYVRTLDEPTPTLEVARDSGLYDNPWWSEATHYQVLQDLVTLHGVGAVHHDRAGGYSKWWTE